MSSRRKAAVVTGGASGMGLAISERLARDGASVAIFDIDGAAAEAVAKRLREDGSSVIAVAVDIADRGKVDQAVREVHNELGPINVLANNAGIAALEPFTSISRASWDRVIGVNLTGTFNCTQAILNDMIQEGWGRIINISSLAGQAGAAFLTHYAASKGGVISLTKALALELGACGVTVNTISPGAIDTPMLRRAMEAGDLGGHSIEEVPSPPPVGRVGTPEEIAAACAFLASEDAGYITGQVIAVNGGMYM